MTKRIKLTEELLIEEWFDHIPQILDDCKFVEQNKAGVELMLNGDKKFTLEQINKLLEKAELWDKYLKYGSGGVMVNQEQENKQLKEDIELSKTHLEIYASKLRITQKHRDDLKEELKIGKSVRLQLTKERIELHEKLEIAKGTPNKTLLENMNLKEKLEQIDVLRGSIENAIRITAYIEHKDGNIELSQKYHTVLGKFKEILESQEKL